MHPFYIFYITFNPRSYKRSDSTIFFTSSLFFSFNPRSYKRSDNIGVTTSQQMLLSIHAPTRGATCLYGFGYIAIFLSIHAPTRGATSSVKVINYFTGLSIHAPTRGATWMPFLESGFRETFNPRSYKRSDSY